MRVPIAASVLAAALLALLPASPLAGKGSPLERRVVPAGEQTGGVTRHGDFLRTEVDGLTVQIRWLDEKSRRDWFQVRSLLQMDPFPGLAQWEKGFTVFELSFLNGTREQVQFQPAMAIVAPANDSEDFPPYDIDNLFSYFNNIFMGDFQRTEQAMSSLYTGGVTLRPGQRVSKLLVYPGLPKNLRRFTLSLESLYIGPRVLELGFLYTVEKPGSGGSR